MTKQLELRSRTKEIADRLEQGASTRELLAEYTLKWECTERTVAKGMDDGIDALRYLISYPPKKILAFA